MGADSACAPYRQVIRRRDGAAVSGMPVPVLPPCYGSLVAGALHYIYTKHMFEEWLCLGDPPTRRVVDPPIAVVVNVSTVMDNPDDKFRSDNVSMRVKMEGISTNCEVTRGLLHAWVQSTRGGWWGLMSFELATGNGKGRLAMRQWCPARSFRRAPLDDRRG